MTLTCSICNISNFRSESSLLRHNKKHHAFLCPFQCTAPCKYASTTYAELRLHQSECRTQQRHVATLRESGAAMTELRPKFSFQSQRDIELYGDLSIIPDPSPSPSPSPSITEADCRVVVYEQQQPLLTSEPLLTRLILPYRRTQPSSPRRSTRVKERKERKTQQQPTQEQQPLPARPPQTSTLRTVDLQVSYDASQCHVQ